MGGKAFLDVQPVHKSRIQTIVNHVIDQLPCVSDYALLGSTGKKEYSGDIDIAVSCYFETLMGQAVNAFGEENVNLQGRAFYMIYLRVDIDGTPAQVDLACGNVKVLQFTQFAPHLGDSAYGGKERTELLKAVAKARSEVAVRNNEVVARSGFTLHYGYLELSSRWRAKKKNAEGYVKKMVTCNDVGAWQLKYPKLKFMPKQFYIDVNTIAFLMFNWALETELLNTYEGVSAIIALSAVLDDKRDLIWQLYTDRLDEIKTPHPVRMI